MRKILVVGVSIFLFGMAHAGSVIQSKAVNVSQLADELNTETGLNFVRSCLASTCTVHGNIHYSAKTGKVKVTVYEELHPSVAHISSATFSGALQSSIAQVMTDHTP